MLTKLLYLLDHFKLNLFQTKKTFQNCTTPSGVKGHCKRYQHCQQLDPKEHIWKILGQLCVIENM